MSFEGRTGEGHGSRTLGAGVRPRPASPVLRVIKNDSIDRFACCLLIYSDSFMGTAGWVPAGQPHGPPASSQPALCRGAHSLVGTALAGQGPSLSESAGRGRLGTRCSPKAQSP